MKISVLNIINAGFYLLGTVACVFDSPDGAVLTDHFTTSWS